MEKISNIKQARYALQQGKEDQLRKLRAAEDSALPAAEDDDLAASYEGSLQLTIQAGKDLKLKPEQVYCQAKLGSPHSEAK